MHTLAKLLIVALALAAGPLSAKEHRSREVTREFQREHPSINRAHSRRLSGLCEGSYRPAGVRWPGRSFQHAMADGRGCGS
jgi:hypothetical protein